MPLPLKMTMFPFGREVLESGRQMLRARKVTRSPAMASPPACVENPAIAPTIAETSGQLAEPPVPLHTAAGVTSDIEVDQTEIAQHQNSVRYEEQAEVESLDLPHRPFHGEIKEFVPGERIVIERVLDLDRDLFLRDHVFIPAQDYKPVEECMPLFPMAAMVEAMAETAEILAPELGVIGVEQMQAVRWIAFRDQKMVTIRIEARVVPIDSQKDVVAVHTELSSNGESNATALVLLGPAFEETLQVSFSPRDGSRRWAYTADEIYRDRHAFHGPRLQCVTKTGPAGALGADGVLTVLPIDDWFVDDPRPQFIFDIATLDGVAQALGGWVRGYGKFSVPMGFQKMERYQDTPPLGTEAVIRLELMKGDENHGSMYLTSRSKTARVKFGCASSASGCGPSIGLFEESKPCVNRTKSFFQSASNRMAYLRTPS